MSYVHLLSATEAQTRLTQVVKHTQGSNRTASWKPASRPCWWVNEHTVTLHDGTQVCTGIFDGQAKRKWRKSHFQAALFLYEQWAHRHSHSPESKSETQLKQESKDEITPAPRTAEENTREKRVLAPPRPRKKNNGKRKQRVVEQIHKEENQLEPQEEPERVVQIDVASRTRGRGNRSKNELVIHKEETPVMTNTTHSLRRNSSSSVENDESPTPNIRRRRVRDRRKAQKTSLQIQTPIPRRQLRSRKARNGKALVRNTGIKEARREAIPRSPKSPGSDAKSRVAPSRLIGSESNSDDDISPIRTRRRANKLANVTSLAAKDSPRVSPQPSISINPSPSPYSSKTRKRSLSEAEVEPGTEAPRTPLQERNDPANMQRNRLRKKRRITDSENLPSDKENQTPPTTAKSKSTRLRSVRGKNVICRDAERQPTETEIMITENEENEQEDVDEGTEQRRKAQHIKLLRDQIEKVKMERDHHLKLVYDRLAQFELECNRQKTITLHKVRFEYRKKKMKFSKQVLEMPISKFAHDHGGSVDEWMIHETEEGVNRTFQALHHGQDPNDGAMGPPKTPSAMSRRAVLTKTARKTRRRVDNEAAAAGLTVRRSQRTAAKVATERTRRIIASTPRTAKKEVSTQGHVYAASSRATNTAGPVALNTRQDPLSEQEMDSLVQSMNESSNPVEAFRNYTRQLQEKFMSTRK